MKVNVSKRVTVNYNLTPYEDECIENAVAVLEEINNQLVDPELSEGMEQLIRELMKIGDNEPIYPR